MPNFPNPPAAVPAAGITHEPTMNLQPISGTTPFYFACIRCNAVTNSRQGFADLDGPPFQAYYCAACAEQINAIGKTEGGASSNAEG